VVLGVSTDTLRLQEEFSEEQKLNFPLLADAELKATRAFGVRSPVLFAQRKTFIIDKHGTVRKVYENVDFKKHAAEVFAYVKEYLAR
jgi:peroxiredoxin Q/BCP